MRPGSVQRVPAGKRPKLKNQKGFYKIIKQDLKSSRTRIKGGRLKASSFILVSVFILSLVLGLYSYLGSFVYAVMLDGREIGVVEEADQVENLVAELAERCSEYYGMEVAIENRIRVVKEYRPQAVPDPDSVQEIIRQQVSFVTAAYLVTVDDVPLVPVASEEVLDAVIGRLEDAYRNESNGSKILDIAVVEDFALKSCSVSPRNVFTADEVMALLLDQKVERSLDATYWAQVEGRSFTGPHQPFEDSNPHPVPDQVVSGDQEQDPGQLLTNNAGVHVESIEEFVVTEKIPYNVETVYDEELWIVQNEITVPGEDGIKEIVYHITRQNGAEVKRTLVSESIIKEPVTQVEARGTSQVPSKGTGKFIWPVAGGGEVTPGRGFSTWHTGIDIDAETGTKVFAADSGVVWFSGFGGSQGNYIIIYHGRYWTLYLHNHINHVSTGAKVDQGDVIAEAGSTGRSTGPHLHFEVRRDDGSGEWRAYYQHKPIDPLQFFRP